MYVENLSMSLALWNDRYKRNLVNAFRELQDEGVLEIITCGATHGFLAADLDARIATGAGPDRRRELQEAFWPPAARHMAARMCLRTRRRSICLRRPASSTSLPIRTRSCTAIRDRVSVCTRP